MKLIKVTDITGKALQGAHVINKNTLYATITNSKGEATIIGDQNDIVEISHVSGSSFSTKMSDLKSVVELFPNSLDEVIITSKKRSYKPLIITLLSIISLFVLNSKNQ